MGNAWETTPDDVQIVLTEHSSDLSAELVFDDYILRECDRIESAVLDYTDFYDQTDVALSTIEDILIEEKVLSDFKRFQVG